jgi:hypothetical protein
MLITILNPHALGKIKILLKNAVFLAKLTVFEAKSFEIMLVQIAFSTKAFQKESAIKRSIIPLSPSQLS